MKLEIELSKEALEQAKSLCQKYGVDLNELLSRIVNDILLYEIDDVEEYMNYHKYGDMKPLDKIMSSLLDLFELGIVTYNSLEQYIIEELEAHNYWLQDYSIDLDELDMWFLFTGTGVVEEFTLDLSPDGASIIAVHGIEDLVSENQSIIDKLREAASKIETNFEIKVDEEEVKIIARASSFSKLPKIKELEKIMNKILESAGIDLSKR